MNFLLGIGRFWESGDTGVAGIALKLGVRLERISSLRCAGLCRVLRSGCIVVCRKLLRFLMIFCRFSVKIYGETKLETVFNDGFAG